MRIVLHHHQRKSYYSTNIGLFVCNYDEHKHFCLFNCWLKALRKPNFQLVMLKTSLVSVDDSEKPNFLLSRKWPQNDKLRFLSLPCPLTCSPGMDLRYNLEPFFDQGLRLDDGSGDSILLDSSITLVTIFSIMEVKHWVTAISGTII